MTLPLALLRCIRRPFVAPVIPRLFLILFRSSQPALIRWSLKFVTTTTATATTTSSSSIPSVAGLDVETRGYWLVFSAVTIYVGLAVSWRPLCFVLVDFLTLILTTSERFPRRHINMG